MLNCRDVTRLASDWIDGELPLRDRLRVRTHLWMCRHCRRFMAGFEAGRDLLRKTSQSPVPARFYTQLDRAIEQQLRRQSGPAVVAAETFSPAEEASNQPFVEGVAETDNHKVRRIFADIEAREGHVPNLFRAYAHHPEILEHNWNRVKTLMYDGILSLRLKNAIAAVVSQDNGCEYCVVYHSSMLQTLGMTPRQVEALLHQDQAPGFAPQEAALLQLARHSNRDPQGTTLALIDQAREAGAREAALIEALGVMELYSSFNKFLDTLKIPLDVAAGE
ncbi:MAG: carboxymuconolactone decarboxylase family protein [Oleiphilaceae bacterium]|nr:carboxymuconolactone decarboxylase family protein [Oleiphilaceae bacterium]